MSKKIKIEIKHWISGAVLFEYEAVDNTIAKTVEEAVKRYADLRSADLRSANLGYANLGYADLRSADLGYADLRSANLRSAKNLNKYYASDLSLLLLQKNRLTAYKYLTKAMQSPVQSMGKITYEVGKTYKEKVNSDRLEDCGEGLNIASLEWCLKETDGNIKDYKFIEVSFDPKHLVVPYFTDGKFRVSELKVERKLTQKDLKPFTEAIK